MVRKVLVFILTRPRKWDLLAFMHLAEEEERVCSLVCDERTLSWAVRNLVSEGCPAEEGVSLSAPAPFAGFVWKQADITEWEVKSRIFTMTHMHSVDCTTWINLGLELVCHFIIIQIDFFFIIVIMLFYEWCSMQRCSKRKPCLISLYITKRATSWCQSNQQDACSTGWYQIYVKIWLQAWGPTQYVSDC